MTATEDRREELQAQIEDLMRAAETGEQWAEICRLEAEMNGGPFFDSEQDA